MRGFKFILTAAVLTIFSLAPTTYAQDSGQSILESPVVVTESPVVVTESPVVVTPVSNLENPVVVYTTPVVYQTQSYYPTPLQQFLLEQQPSQ